MTFTVRERLAADRPELPPPPVEPAQTLASHGAPGLAADLQYILDGQPCLGLWRTLSRGDAGAWLVFPRRWLILTPAQLHDAVEASAWLGGVPTVKTAAVTDMELVRFNDFTGAVDIRLSGGRRWPPLRLDPFDGHAVVALIERLRA